MFDKLDKLFESLNTNDLLHFFKVQDYSTLYLEDEEYKILREMKITGTSFLNCTKEDLMSTKLKWGMAIEIHVLKEKVTHGK